jgi:hypothetical protein
MKFFRIDLLTLLISLFILNSCKNQDTAGFTLGTKGTLSGSLVDTATIYTNTITDDSISTTGIEKCPIGFITDPIFGTSSAGLATDLNLPLSSSYTPPAGTITIDSAVLIMKYADGFYGDSTQNYTLNVYQLGSKFNDNNTYYSNFVWNVSSTLLASQGIMPRPLDTVRIDSAISGRKDSLVKHSPELRVPLNKSFFSTNLFQAGSTTLNSNLIFNNNVKGLYINVSKASGPGGIMMFKGDSLSVNLYIRAVSGTVIDTTVVTLPISHHASSVTRSYSTVVQAAINNKTPTDSLVYFEGLAGTRVKVSFPFIQQLFSTKGGSNNVVINHAELVVTPYPGTNMPGTDIPSYLAPLPKLTLYRYDIAHTRIEVDDAVGASTPTLVADFGGYLQLGTPRSPAAYHFLVTTYLQNLITNRTKDYGTYIAPVDTTNTAGVDIAPTISVAARTYAPGGYINAPGVKNNPYAMKLNVIYTQTK